MSDVRHEARPELLEPLLAPFRLTRRARLVASLLVWLARIPGATPWLLRWHSRRTQMPA